MKISTKKPDTLTKRVPITLNVPQAPSVPAIPAKAYWARMVFPVDLMLSATGERLQRRTANPAKTHRCHEVMLGTAPIISKVTDKEDLIALGQLELRKGK